MCKKKAFNLQHVSCCIKIIYKGKMGIWFSENFQDIFWKQTMLGKIGAVGTDDWLTRRIFQNVAMWLLMNSWVKLLTPTFRLSWLEKSAYCWKEPYIIIPFLALLWYLVFAYSSVNRSLILGCNLDVLGDSRIYRNWL